MERAPLCEEPLSTTQNTRRVRGVGFGCHDLIDEGGEGDDPSRGGATAQGPALVNVVGGEVSQRPTASIFELFTPDPTGSRGQVRVAAGQGLELRFLVRADHELVRGQGLSVPDAVVEVKDPACFEREVGVAGEDPRPARPRLGRVRVQPPAHRGNRHGVHDFAGDGFGR